MSSRRTWSFAPVCKSRSIIRGWTCPKYTHMCCRFTLDGSCKRICIHARPHGVPSSSLKILHHSTLWRSGTLSTRCLKMEGKTWANKRPPMSALTPSMWLGQRPYGRSGAESRLTSSTWSTWTSRHCSHLMVGWSPDSRHRLLLNFWEGNTSMNGAPQQMVWSPMHTGQSKSAWIGCLDHGGTVGAGLAHLKVPIVWPHFWMSVFKNVNRRLDAQAMQQCQQDRYYQLQLMIYWHINSKDAKNKERPNSARRCWRPQNPAASIS